MASSEAASPPGSRLPLWIRTSPPTGERYPEVRSILTELRLDTVCREARCPNLSECWSAGAATLMLLGTDCTRRCSFCAVHTHWPRGIIDRTEPDRVGEAVERWGLRYVVLTQVCRDDLPDGGASLMGDTVRSIRSRAPETLVELLTGDLGGSPDSLQTLLDARPDVLAHNLETVRRLSDEVRDRRASYDGSLRLLRRARTMGPPGLVTKSSIMIGLGETDEDLEEAFLDLREAGVDLLTLGQYLRPSLDHRPVARYLPPDGFDRLAERARAAGFSGVEAGPLVRSSYRAEALFRSAQARTGS